MIPHSAALTPCLAPETILPSRTTLRQRRRFLRKYALLFFLGGWILLGWTQIATSQDPVGSLRVEDALERASKSHPSLRRARIALEEARVRARGEESLLTTLLTVDTGYLRNHEPTQGLLENGVRQTDAVQSSATLSRRLDWGLDLSLNLSTNWVKVIQPFEFAGERREQTIGPNWQQQLALTLRQPLLKGFGREVNLAPERAAKRQVSLAELQERQSTSQTVLEVLISYFELARAVREVDIKERQIGFARAQREATEALIQAGAVPESERDVISQRDVIAEEALLLAEHDRAQKEEDLWRLMGGGHGPISPTSALEVPVPLEDLDEWVEKAREQSFEVRLLEARKFAQEISLDTEKDATRYQLDLTATAGQNTLSDEGLGDASSQLLGTDSSRFFVGVTFSMPLDNSRAEAGLQRTRLELDRIQVQIEETRDRVASEVRNTFRLARLQKKRVNLSGRAVELARKTLEAEEARYKAGRSTNQAVVRFQEELEQAEGREAQARTDFVLSALRVAHLGGELLRLYGLEE